MCLEWPALLQALWQQAAGPGWLYSTSGGRWFVTDREEGVASNTGLLASNALHQGRLPQETEKWQEFVDGAWQLAPSVLVVADVECLHIRGISMTAETEGDLEEFMLHFVTLLHERVSTKAAVHTVGSMFMPSEPCRLPWLHVRTVHQRPRTDSAFSGATTNRMSRLSALMLLQRRGKGRLRAVRAGNPQRREARSSTVAHQKVALVIGFIGSRYHGLQIHYDEEVTQAVTIEWLLRGALLSSGALEESKATSLERNAEWRHSSRTDAGVHACRLVITARLAVGRPDEKGHSRADVRARDDLLPDDVVVFAARLVPATFDARYSCSWREYDYILPASVLTHQVARPCRAGFQRLQIFGAMMAGPPIRAQAAASLCWSTLLPQLHPSARQPEPSTTLVGTFMSENLQVVQRRSKCKGACLAAHLRAGEPTLHSVDTFRRTESKLEACDAQVLHLPGPAEDFIHILLQGNRFLYNQIRYIVGAVAAVSAGYLPEPSLRAALCSSARFRFPVAPSCGLLLRSSGFTGTRQNPCDVAMDQEQVFSRMLPMTTRLLLDGSASADAQAFEKRVFAEAAASWQKDTEESFRLSLMRARCPDEALQEFCPVALAALCVLGGFCIAGGESQFLAHAGAVGGLGDPAWKRYFVENAVVEPLASAMPTSVFLPPGLLATRAVLADKTQEAASVPMASPGFVSVDRPLALTLLERGLFVAQADPAPCPKPRISDVACVAKLARSPNGTEVVSKFLSSNPTAAPMLVSALLPEVACLASHPYGAGVVSELFCHCQDLKLSSAVNALSSCLKGSLVRLTKDRFGCRVVQAALREAMPEFQQCFVSELQGQVLSLCQHLHANFVLQKCIELLEPHLAVFMITELKDHAVSVAVHVYGCRVLQRLIEHCSREPQLIELVDSMLGNAENVEKLLKDLFGSNVLRALLVHGTVHHVKAILDVLGTNVLKFAKHKHASLVFERCLEVSSSCEELRLPRKQLMAQLIQSNLSGKAPLSQVLLDRFGNYLAQRVIQCCCSDEEEMIVKLLASSWPKLQRSPVGRHIIVAATRRPCSRLAAFVSASPETPAASGEEAQDLFTAKFGSGIQQNYQSLATPRHVDLARARLESWPLLSPSARKERAKPSMQQPVKELPVAPTLLTFLPPPGFEHFVQKTLPANDRPGVQHHCSRNGAEQPDGSGQTSPSDTGLRSSAARPEAAGTDIADYIVKIIRTEVGSEGMVQCLASASALGLAVAVAAVLPELPDLACDVHASKVLIALLEHCRDVSQYRVRLVQRLRGHLLKLTKDKTGCVVMQRMLDVAAVELQSCLPLELRGKVLACSQHLHGNFVLQRCVEVFPPESLSFLILELKGHAASVATHIYACRILQRLVERCPSHPEMPELLQSILQPMDQLERLCKDPYGNNVVRSLLLRGSGTAARFVINAISTDILKFSRNRHSSLVVERCIMVSSDERQEEFRCAKGLEGNHPFVWIPVVLK
ncbi:pum [Symbiodinium necroappetens]|uniref:Pum protein n=1 Tax=Symbiodinium necroappetens TaxID=1628268 RepID=A0A812TPQ0_9DINO|nr:pum [Symbiodinium necroappetens]